MIVEKSGIQQLSMVTMNTEDNKLVVRSTSTYLSTLSTIYLSTCTIKNYSNSRVVVGTCATQVSLATYYSSS
jgi:hypothetical protein